LPRNILYIQILVFKYTRDFKYTFYSSRCAVFATGMWVVHCTAQGRLPPIQIARRPPSRGSPCLGNLLHTHPLRNNHHHCMFKTHGWAGKVCRRYTAS
jgi:hypothetical protein